MIKILFQLQNKNRHKITTTTVIKNELKYYPMSEGNTSIAKPHLEVLAYSAVNKNLPHVTNN